MAEKNNDQKLATSRLLDLLRAQQVGPPESDDDSPKRSRAKEVEPETEEISEIKTTTVEKEIPIPPSKVESDRQAKVVSQTDNEPETDQVKTKETPQKPVKSASDEELDPSDLPKSTDDFEARFMTHKTVPIPKNDAADLKKKLDFLTTEFSKSEVTRQVETEQPEPLPVPSPETTPPKEQEVLVPEQPLVVEAKTEIKPEPESEPQPDPEPEPQPQPQPQPEPISESIEKVKSEPVEAPQTEISSQSDDSALGVDDLQPPPSKSPGGANQTKLMSLLNALEKKDQEPSVPATEEPVLSADDILGTTPIGAPLKNQPVVEVPEPILEEDQLPVEPESQPDAPKKPRGARNLLDRRKKFIEAEKSEKATEAIRTQLVEEAQQRSTSFEIEVDDEGWALPLGFGPDLFEMAESLAPSLQADQFTANLMRRIMKSSHRICLDVDDHGVRYLEAKVAGSGFTVQKFGRLTLPYKLDDATTIKDIRTLVEVALPKIFDKKSRKNSYTTIYSNQFQGKTHFFLSPPGLGKKDLGELINWQAQKNMNLGEGRGILRHFAQSSPTSGGKDHVVILGADKEATKQALALYKKSGFKIRYTSQLPAILWHAFKREYPDQANRTVILLHMEQSKTTLVVVHQGVLLTTREIAVGIDDFEAALEQKVNIDGKALNLNRTEARKIFFDYGIPKNPIGKIKPHGLTLYRVSIFLRPVIERLTSEIQRSINFFKKQYNELSWDHIYISGLGGAVPNLSRALKENLGFEISLFNPVRAENVSYADEDHPIPFEEFPNYVTLFSMLSIQSNDYNLLPQEMLLDQQLIPYATVAGLAAAILVPIILLSVTFQQIRANDLKHELETKEAPLRNMSPKTEQYLGFQKDIRILDQYEGFLETDSLKSENYVKVLKFLSHIVPVEIKLTKLTIDKDLKGGVMVSDSTNIDGVSDADSYRDFVLLDGFVESDRSVSDIQLTNFKMKVEKAGFFKKVKMVIKPRDDKEGERRFFEMDCEF